MAASKTLSYRLARAAAIISFTVALLMFLGNLIITVVPEKVPVIDKSGTVVGEAHLPQRTDEYGLIFLAFIVLSGFQIWTLSLIPKEDEKRPSDQSPKPTVPSGRGSP